MISRLLEAKGTPMRRFTCGPHRLLLINSAYSNIIHQQKFCAEQPSIKFHQTQQKPLNDEAAELLYEARVLVKRLISLERWLRLQILSRYSLRQTAVHR